MKKFLILMLMISSLASYAQKTNLLTVNTVKPKKGQKMAFEAAYKLHAAKFHKTSENVNVYEIMSGTYAGYYHIVTGNRSYADFDKERTDAAAHSIDLDKTFFPFLDETMNATYRFIDTLSLRSDVVADKFVVTLRHLKQNINMANYKKEQSRTVKINSQLKGGFWSNLSYSLFEQLWAGTAPVHVSIRALKDGFKSLEPDYYGATPAGVPSFRDEYAKAYGHADWDARIKLMEDATDKTEVYIMRLRKDLSTGQ
jgi:hypothetical protein